ncbi:MAG: TonB-dependent receptor domain-containing protein [Endozoicomonas sp.]
MKYLAVGLGLFSSLLTASEELHLDVHIREPSMKPGSESEQKPSQSFVPATDTGQWLRQEHGVTAARKGGKGFEPIIRGQQQSQLNMIMGDAVVNGACPGRMDPSSGYGVLSGYDRVRVLRGYESVTHGSGGAGGTVLFERDDPDFTERTFHARAGAGYTGNINSKTASADLSAGNNRAYLRAYGEHQGVGNYRDGSGNTVSSAFNSTSGGIVLSGQVMPSTRLEMNIESVRDDDIHYSGSGMDAPWARADTWRFKVSHGKSLAFFDNLELSTYHADVEHLMDNYSVRRRKPGQSEGVKAPSSANSWGGKLIGTTFFDNAELSSGLDYRASDRSAKRFKVNLKQGGEEFQSYIWPGIEYRQIGIFSELDHKLSHKDNLRLGIRYDHFSADATRAGSTALGDSSPDEMYRRHYGYGAEKIQENNVSGLLGWQHQLVKGHSLELRFSRVVRTADASERFIASRGSCCHGSDDQVGNPRIKPERHHQLDAGYRVKSQQHELGFNVYLDEVSDYIVRSQGDSGAYIYKNVDARLYGVEFETAFRFGYFKPAMTVAWTYGANRTSGGSLPQIPPLAVSIKFDYERPEWMLGAKWDLAMRQVRVNSASGLDTGETPGYGVLHLHGWYHLSKDIKLLAGVENLFDKTYALHVNRASRDPFNPEAERVNEPGRQIWVGIRLEL